MTPLRSKDSTTGLLIALIVLSLTTVSLPLTPATAQLPGLYSVSGQVYDGHGTALAGAEVALVPEADGEKQSTATDDAGNYSFQNLSAGDYTLVATHACCWPAEQAVTLGGATLQRTIDLTLRAQDVPVTNDTATLSGAVFHADGGERLSGVRIEISNWFSGGSSSGEVEDRVASPGYYPPDYHEQGFQHFTVTSGADGSYTVEVNKGTVELFVDHPGYDYLRVNLPIEQDRRIDLQMQPSGDLATISGVVRGTDGRPIADAGVNVWRNYDNGCDGDVCIARTEPGAAGGGPGGSSSGDVSYYYEPRANSYGWAQTDREGRFTIEVTEGTYQLSVWANHYVSHYRQVEARTNDETRVDITLERIPDATVRVHGRVLDATTGEPIPYADVNAENQRWGTWNWSQTDATGRFELWIQPGYTIVQASAWKWYWIQECNGGDVPVSLADEQDAAAKESAIRAPEPHLDCNREREHEYVMEAFSFTGQTGQAREQNIELRRLPAPDAVFQGWVVNASSEKGVADVRVTFQNQYTRDWGEAVTDTDGSFKIPVRSGYYLIRTWTEKGYYDAVLTTDIATDETKTLAIKIQPGTRAGGGYCCIAYAESGVAMDKAAGDSRAGAPAAMDGSEDAAMAGDSMGMSRGSADQTGQAPEGQQAFQGDAGGLGPYDPSRTGSVDGIGTEAPTPAVGPLVVMLALVGAAGVVGVAYRRKR